MRRHGYPLTVLTLHSSLFPLPSALKKLSCSQSETLQIAIESGTIARLGQLNPVRVETDSVRLDGNARDSVAIARHLLVPSDFTGVH